MPNATTPFIWNSPYISSSATASLSQILFASLYIAGHDEVNRFIQNLILKYYEIFELN